MKAMPAASAGRAPDGPYTSLDGLIACRSQAESLLLRPGRRATRLLAGGHQSRLRGRGMDFAEVRGYQPGDDVRHIDWRVTARTTIAHTKTFTEERERPTLFLCDQRAPMFFGSRLRFKSVQAANIAAILAWAALRGRDRVGGLLLGQDAMSQSRPQHSDRAVLRLLSTLNEFNRSLRREQLASPPRHSLGEALCDLRRTARTGTAIFLISDFSDLQDDSLRHLYELSQHNSVWAFAIFDPLERTLPPAGRYRLCAGAREIEVDTRNPRRRQQFEAAVESRRAHLHGALARLGIPLLEVATTEDPMSALQRVFQRTRRGPALA